MGAQMHRLSQAQKQPQNAFLSVCMSGLGQAQSEEGVYGIQRALTMAVARSILFSFWKEDYLTALD